MRAKGLSMNSFLFHRRAIELSAGKIRATLVLRLSIARLYSNAQSRLIFEGAGRPLPAKAKLALQKIA